MVFTEILIHSYNPKTRLDLELIFLSCNFFVHQYLIMGWLETQQFFFYIPLLIKN